MKATIIKVSMIEGKGYDAMKPLLFAIMDSITPKDIVPLTTNTEPTTHTATYPKLPMNPIIGPIIPDVTNNSFKFISLISNMLVNCNFRFK